MLNPRVYFSIHKNGYLLPVRTQNKDLDNAFGKQKVIDANIAAVNKYTQEIIDKYSKKGELFWSESYDFNPETFVFVFYELNICTDDDYMKMSEEPCEFDAYVSYTHQSQATADVTVGDTLLDKLRENTPCPSLDKTGFYIESKKWFFLSRNIKRHINTMLIGPTGTGKTDIVQRICKSLGLELNIFDMGSMQDPITGLLGTRDLVESKSGNPVSKFNYARFVDAIQKPGVILLDELSRAPQEATNILFPCLDNRRKLFVDIAPEGMNREIAVHPECTFIATANIGAEYTGTSDIDAALLNRFLPMQLDYLPESIEVNVLTTRTSIPTATARKLVAFVNKIRAEYSQGTITKSVSTRESLACAELVEDGFPLIDAIDFVITNKYMNNNYNDELTYVKKLIMGM